MKVFITLDYELFFGKSGTVEKTIIEPTQKLVKILDKHNAKAVFFVDVGYLIKSEELESKYPELKDSSKKVIKQIKELVAEGHDIQLHIHSHWEDAQFTNGQWVFPMTHYRLHSYSEEECIKIVKKYKNYLEAICGKQVNGFRAGGWCLQPFDKLKTAFLEAGIKFDSTVFKGGRNIHGAHYYDFNEIPEATKWNFSDDPCVIDDQGSFTEFPIASFKVSPLFFWKLIYYKKFGGQKHHQIGDGYAISNGLWQKLRLLLTRSYTVVSVDGYKASLVQKAFLRQKKKYKSGNFVIIGHPKAFSKFSLKKLDEFLIKQKEQIEIKTFSDL
ncbi:polysaccharide deacetylase family protein [Winogradskyella forsetii]|uniref:polysaccharide deacetylase family protein n=1 Tax=Winogradskyella forsetii TaxID=2686077 RepID=UPI0015BCC780|nr:polysaccharide deacetylase family protein [Winogradskyella forsetii]